MPELCTAFTQDINRVERDINRVERDINKVERDKNKLRITPVQTCAGNMDKTGLEKKQIVIQKKGWFTPCYYTAYPP
jgi:hypothetical protein